jgi:hypothetical protein
MRSPSLERAGCKNTRNRVRTKVSRTVSVVAVLRDGEGWGSLKARRGYRWKAFVGFEDGACDETCAVEGELHEEESGKEEQCPER